MLTFLLSVIFIFWMSRPLLPVVIISVCHQGAFAYLGLPPGQTNFFLGERGCITILGLHLGSDCSVISEVKFSPVHSRQVWGWPFRGPSCSHTSVGSAKSFFI